MALTLIPGSSLLNSIITQKDTAEGEITSSLLLPKPETISWCSLMSGSGRASLWLYLMICRWYRDRQSLLRFIAIT
jgi:hypothetical protein